jgi:hypothetical protein
MLPPGMLRGKVTPRVAAAGAIESHALFRRHRSKTE